MTQPRGLPIAAYLGLLVALALALAFVAMLAVVIWLPPRPPDVMREDEVAEAFQDGYDHMLAEGAPQAGDGMAWSVRGEAPDGMEESDQTILTRLRIARNLTLLPHQVRVAAADVVRSDVIVFRVRDLEGAGRDAADAVRQAREAERLVRESERMARESEELARESERLARESEELVAAEHADPAEAQRAEREAGRLGREAARLAQLSARLAREAERKAEREARETERVDNQSAHMARETERQVLEEATREAERQVERELAREALAARREAAREAIEAAQEARAEALAALREARRVGARVVVEGNTITVEGLSEQEIDAEIEAQLEQPPTTFEFPLAAPAAPEAPAAPPAPPAVAGAPAQAIPAAPRASPPAHVDAPAPVAPAAPVTPTTPAPPAAAMFAPAPEGVALISGFEIAAELPDGRWLVMRQGRNWAELGWIGRAALVIGATLLALSVMAVLFARRLTRPIRAFSEAVQAVGVDPQSEAVLEEGPQELRGAARAVNVMQARLRALIADRTKTLAAVAHDMRTPLMRLRLAAENTPPEQRERMAREIEEVEALVASFIAFARDDPAVEARVRLDLSALLQSMADDQTEAGREVSFSGPEREIVTGQTLGLKRLFANLVENALKYGGCARITLARDGGHVIVDIEDDGAGIPNEQREAVFEPFVRLASGGGDNASGAGLGLPAARSIARAHGGEVAIFDGARGARVRVTLPV